MQHKIRYMSSDCCDCECEWNERRREDKMYEDMKRRRKHATQAYAAHIWAGVHGKKHSRAYTTTTATMLKAIALRCLFKCCIAQAHCIQFSALALKNRSLCIAFNIKIQNDKEHNFLHTRSLYLCVRVCFYHFHRHHRIFTTTAAAAAQQ